MLYEVYEANVLEHWQKTLQSDQPYASVNTLQQIQNILDVVTSNLLSKQSVTGVEVISSKKVRQLLEHPVYSFTAFSIKLQDFIKHIEYQVSLLHFVWF